MFKLISITVLIACPLVALVLRAACGRGSLGGGGRMRWAACLAYVLTFLGLSALAGTSYYAVFATGEPMAHWALIAHVGASPLLMVGLLGVAVLRGARYGHGAQPSWEIEVVWSSSVALDTPRGATIRRGLFWLFVVAVLTAMLAALVMMTSLTGTHGQELLYEIHRYGGLAAVGFAIMHLIGPR